MSHTHTEIVVPKGSTGVSYTFTLALNGVAINLTGKQLTFTVAPYAGAAMSFRKRNTAAGGSDAEIEVTDAVNGVCKVKFVAADTTSLAPGIYVCDMWMVDGTDETQVLPVTPFRVGQRVKT